MTDKRISELAARAILTLEDLIEVVGEDGGSPSQLANYKAPLGALKAFLRDGWSFASLPADANPTLAVNTFYSGSIAGYTADRTAALPATAAVGDRVGIFLTAGDDAYELLLTAANGDTLNGVAGGTEWSRIFITNECVIFRCIAENATWIVEYDGRIAQRATLRLSTSASGEGALTFTRPTDKGGAWTADIDNASIANASVGEIKTRRAANVELTGSAFSSSAITDQKFVQARLYKNGTTTVLATAQLISGTTQTVQVPIPAMIVPLVADDYVPYLWRSEEGSKGLAALSEYRSFFSMVEKL